METNHPHNRVVVVGLLDPQRRRNQLISTSTRRTLQGGRLTQNHGAQIRIRPFTARLGGISPHDRQDREDDGNPPRPGRLSTRTPGLKASPMHRQDDACERDHRQDTKPERIHGLFWTAWTRRSPVLRRPNEPNTVLFQLIVYRTQVALRVILRTQTRNGLR